MYVTVELSVSLPTPPCLDFVCLLAPRQEGDQNSVSNYIHGSKLKLRPIRFVSPNSFEMTYSEVVILGSFKATHEQYDLNISDIYAELRRDLRNVE
jgi:hypothetical protein